jgi:hypothetical protein
MGGIRAWPLASRDGAAEGACQEKEDTLSALLRLLTLLANCGLSAGAPPVLESPARRQGRCAA